MHEINMRSYFRLQDDCMNQIQNVRSKRGRGAHAYAARRARRRIARALNLERRPAPEAERTTTRASRGPRRPGRGARSRRWSASPYTRHTHSSESFIQCMSLVTSSSHICQFKVKPSARDDLSSHTECHARHGLGVIASHAMDLGSWAYTLSLVHSVQYMAHVGPPYRHTCSLVCASVHGFSRSLAQRTKTSTMRVRSAAWCHRPKDQASIYIKQVRTNNRALLPSGLLLSAHAALSPAPCSRAPSLRSCPTRRTA